MSDTQLQKNKGKTKKADNNRLKKTKKNMIREEERLRKRKAKKQEKQEKRKNDKRILRNILNNKKYLQIKHTCKTTERLRKTFEVWVCSLHYVNWTGSPSGL